MTEDEQRQGERGGRAAKPKYMLLGVGSILSGDDGVGDMLASEFARELERPGGADPDWEVHACATMPENFVAVVRRQHPEVAIVVDAADLGLEPGEVRRVPPQKIACMLLTTHTLPLSMLMEKLEEAARRVVLVGIQPASFEAMEELTPPVSRAKQQVLELLRRRAWDRIPELE